MPRFSFLCGEWLSGLKRVGSKEAQASLDVTILAPFSLSLSIGDVSLPGNVERNGREKFRCCWICDGISKPPGLINGEALENLDE